MTLRSIFKKQLGKKAFDNLSKEWKQYIRAVDSLPKQRRSSVTGKKSPPHNLKNPLI